MPNVIEDMLQVVNTPAGPAVNVPTVAGIKVAPGITLADKLGTMEAALAGLESRPAPVPATQTRPGMAKGSDTVIVDAEGGFHAVGVGTSVSAGGAFVGQWLFLRQNPLPLGYIELDGTLYTSAADKFPELLVYLDTHQNELTTEEDWQARSAAASGTGGVPFYAYDAVENTLRMPDTRGDSPYHGTVGTWDCDAIRNIEGVINAYETPLFYAASGAFKTGAVSRYTAGYRSGSSTSIVTLDTSLVVPTDSTNHPRRIGLTFVVYAGITGAL